MDFVIAYMGLTHTPSHYILCTTHIQSLYYISIHTV